MGEVPLLFSAIRLGQAHVRLRQYVWNSFPPERILKLRKEIFERIKNSNESENGVFETADVFNFSDKIRDYIVQFIFVIVTFLLGYFAANHQYTKDVKRQEKNITLLINQILKDEFGKNEILLRLHENKIINFEKMITLKSTYYTLNDLTLIEAILSDLSKISDINIASDIMYSYFQIKQSRSELNRILDSHKNDSHILGKKFNNYFIFLKGTENYCFKGLLHRQRPQKCCFIQVFQG